MAFHLHQIALQPQLLQKTMSLLATKAPVFVRLILARRSRLPENVALILATEPDVLTRIMLVRNEHLSESLLESFYMDPEFLVRVEVARRSKNPEVLEILSKDPIGNIRGAVARNPHTPKGIVTRLKRQKRLALLDL